MNSPEACPECNGTGIGWSGPDSRCGECGGNGTEREHERSNAYWDRKRDEAKDAAIERTFNQGN